MLPVSSAFQSGVYANVRQFDSQMYFTCAQLNGGARTLYDDSRIINFNLVEETMTLNDSVPSDQLTIELDNTDGAFNFLNVSNMQTIIAGRPKIELQIGLHDGWRYVRFTGYGDNTGAVTRLVEMSIKDSTGNLIAGQLPLSYTAVSGGSISQITDGVTVSQSGNYPYWLTGNPTVVYDLGSSKQLTEIDVWMYSAVVDQRQTKFKLEVSNDNVNWTLFQDYSTNTVNQDPINGWTFSVAPNIEWLNLGTFYVDAWKNQVKSVILTAHDNLMFLDNIAYNPPAPGTKTLTAIAQDIFSQAGITSAKYSLDPILSTINSNGFKQAGTGTQTLTCRQALQHLAIASQCTVYQDRNGVMQIKSFGTLDSASLYSNYPTSTTKGTGMASLWGYPVANTASSGTPPTPISSNFINENTAGGMRYLGLSQMFDLPIITLEASVYQLSINVYDTNFNSTPSVFTNSAVSAGSNGQSFTIDNPLINTTAQATNVANWFIGEANYNAVYQANWRGNPCLTPTDVVVVENGHPDGNGGVVIDSIKQSRIYRNEFVYNGYLTGTTNARGGL